MQSIEFNLDHLKSDEYQTQLADEIEKNLFPNHEAAKNTAKTVGEFVQDYLDHGRNMPIRTWLIGRFDQYQDIWASEQDKTDTADLIISVVDELTANQVAINQHLNKGKTLANFLNQKIETVAAAHALDAQEIADGMRIGVQQANGQFAELYMGEQLGKQDFHPFNEQTNSVLNSARNIEKRLALNANYNFALQSAKSLGSRLCNAVMGQENLSRSEELRKILRSSVDSAENKGVQVAMSGGFVV
ncbi:hypothetical protein [Lonepinella sp. MS14436]|uniref:hypothetical protein n=1 Tax=Lonepinella sp. MS14436 TaxID=3003619 RepID=UPI0036D79EB8